MSQTPEELAEKIKAAREKTDGVIPSTASANSDPKGTANGKALRAATDLVSAVVVGGFLGYWLDRWLDTKPLFMIIMFLLGFAAGFLNIYRAQMGEDFKIGFKSKDKSDKGS